MFRNIERYQVQGIVGFILFTAGMSALIIPFSDDESFHSLTYNEEDMYFFFLYANIDHPHQIDSAELRCTAKPFEIEGNQYRYNCKIQDQEYGVMLYVLEPEGEAKTEEDSGEKLTFSEQVAIRPTKWE